MKQNKICSKCKLEKPLNRFSKRDKSIDGYRHWCKDCACLNSLQQRRANPEKYKEVDKLTNSKPENMKRREITAKKWRTSNPEKIKNKILKRLYSIDLSTYNKLFSNQNGKCAICKTHQTELKSSLCVDHCHETGKIRGLLCRQCNTALGFLKDSLDLCKAAVKYLSPQMRS